MGREKSNRGIDVLTDRYCPSPALESSNMDFKCHTCQEYFDDKCMKCFKEFCKSCFPSHSCSIAFEETKETQIPQNIILTPNKNIIREKNNVNVVTEHKEKDVNHKLRSKKRKSEAWEHFEFSSTKHRVVICKCGVELRYSETSSTTTMMDHVKNCIQCKKMDEVNPNEKLAKQTLFKINATGIVEINKKTKSIEFNETMSNKNLLNMFIRCELPFRLIEKDEFKEFIKGLRSDFNLPSASTLSLQIRRKFDVSVDEIRSFIHQVGGGKFSITTDVWTSIQIIGYMVMTLHFIDNNWECNHIILSL